MESLYLHAADAILVVHFAFIIFVVGGQLCVIVGYFRGWRWVHNLAFRISHLIAIAVVLIGGCRDPTHESEPTTVDGEVFGRSIAAQSTT